jgi:serine/threonine protein kinase
VFLTPDYLGIAMEYAAGGDMFQHVTMKRGLSEDEARWFFQQLVLGLDYCHKMGIVNRDIKLEVSSASQKLTAECSSWLCSAHAMQACVKAVLESLLPLVSAEHPSRRQSEATAEDM